MKNRAAAAPEGSNYQVDLSTAGAATTPPIVLGNLRGLQYTGHNPPDPVVAAGPNHIMEAVNSRFTIRDKHGNLLKTIEAASWFETTLHGANPFDPRIQYDHFAGRWVMLWHNEEENSGLPSSHYLLSVSDDDNPLSDWSNWALPADVNGSTNSDNAADNGCIGFDKDALYIVSNQFPFDNSDFEYCRLRIIPKAQLLRKRADSVAWTDFWDIRDPAGKKAYAIRPSIVHGVSSAYYLLQIADDPFGASCALYTVKDPLGQPSLTAISVPLTAWTGELGLASQRDGGAHIDDPRSTLTSEVQYQDGSILAVHSVANPFFPTCDCLRYFRIDVSKNQAVDDVTFGAEGYWYLYPALVVDKDMNVAITFSRSGESEYIEARMTWKLKGDSLLHPSVQLQPGWAHYENVDGVGRNRWGDYNGAALDPTDMNSVWLAAEYAETPSNTWGVWVMNMRLAPFATARASISTPAIDFGYTEVGRQSDTLAVVVRNVGSAPLMLNGVTQSSPNFTLLNPRSLPATLATYDSLRLSLIFAPSAVGPAYDTLLVSSNDSASTSTKIALAGTGVEIAGATPGVMYAIQSSKTGSTLDRLNPLNATTIPVGILDTLRFTAITIRPSNSQIYAVAPSPRGAQLFRADSRSGRFFFVRRLSVPDVAAIAFSREDILFAGTTTGDLYRITLPDGSELQIGKAGGVNYTGLCFSPTGDRLWASSGSPLNNDTMYTVNVRDGSVHAVGATGFGDDIFSPAFDQNGRVLCLSGNALIEVDTVSGRGTIAALFGVDGLRSIAINTESNTAWTEQPSASPAVFKVSQNFPNPFNPSTTIKFSLPKTTFVTLRIFNVLGQEVAVLIHEWRQAGEYQTTWNANLPSGIYFYRLQAGEFIETKKMTLLR